MFPMNLDTRMKKYEYVTRTYLTCRMPVIVRLDGKAFHTFTRGLKKPFDPVFNSAMDAVMLTILEMLLSNHAAVSKVA